jgi:hypothetical protein
MVPSNNILKHSMLDPTLFKDRFEGPTEDAVEMLSFSWQETTRRTCVHC